MNVSGLSAYTPYANAAAYTPFVNKITSQLDSQAAAAQQSIDGLHKLSASYEVKISDYGMIQNSLSNLQLAAKKLSGVDAFSLYSAKSTNPTLVTAYAQKNASQGTHHVEVNQLAQGETLLSSTQQSPTAPIGSGAPSTLTFQFVNGSSQSITIGPENNTLTGIAASINKADFGITASVISSGSGFQLMLSGPSGSSNAFNIGVSGDESVARLLSYTNGATNNAMTQTMAAQDSLGSVDGIPFTGSGNLITNTAGGLTLNLSGTGQADITVATDMTQITDAVQSFVDAYNTARSTLSAYQGGELSDDRTLPAIGNGLTNSLKSPPSGAAAPYGLDQIGISLNQDGSLSFDAGVFQDAYSRDPAGVARLFTDNGNGLADQISGQLQGVLQPSGGISSTIDQLISKIQSNQQMEMRIEDQSIQDLQYSAHQYAQQLSMMIVEQIVKQFLQGVTAQPDQAAGKTSGAPLSDVAATSQARPVSGLEALMNSVAPQYNQPGVAVDTSNQI